MKLSDELKSAGRIVVLVMVILFLSVTTCLATGKTGLSASDLTVSVNQKKNLKLRNSSGKITWKILSGKECISVKRSGNKMVVVTGKKKGTAVIQAKNKEKNFTCRVTVKSRLPENRPQGGDGQQTQQGDNSMDSQLDGQGEGMTGGSQEDEKTVMRIVIRAGSRSFPTVLYDHRAAVEMWEKLPLTLDMSELNGNEKYYFMEDALPVDASVPEAVHKGDLMLYGADCLVLFYKDFSTSYTYTPLGRVEKPSGLAEALGTGNVRVVFERADAN